GAVKRRPFVLERKPGAKGGGNMTLMLGALGVVVVVGICLIAFLSTKGTTKQHKMAAQAAKPNLGRYAQPTAPGDLVPENKMKPAPAETKKASSIEASDIEHTKSVKPAQAQPTVPPAGKALNQVPTFQEPDTTPGEQQKWSPPPYGSNSASEQQA